eukprot:8084_1
MSQPAVKYCKRLNISDSNSVHHASTFDGKKFKFNKVELSLDDINKYLETDIEPQLLTDFNLTDIKIQSWWCDSYEIPMAYARHDGTDTGHWVNPEYGWKYDNVRPKKLLLEFRYSFAIGYVFNLNKVLQNILDDTFLSEQIALFVPMAKEPFKFEFVYEFCSQPYERCEMGFDYGYWHQNFYEIEFLNNPNAKGVIMSNHWGKRKFRALFLSMICLGYIKVLTQCAFVDAYAEWMDDYSPYDDGYKTYKQNVGLFADIHGQHELFTRLIEGKMILSDIDVGLDKLDIVTRIFSKKIKQSWKPSYMFHVKP